ncbi:exostosin-1-like protein [Dinothrombium tinctorium]|uniref:Exostosin-1-like protein n=1 Tax=Dinothrombium tinctorium TaxID=1965070 RepID=A0A3S3P252_9ACAR|nr:exostosin-1-like protein [Dinothrombium tinctorium]
MCKPGDKLRIHIYPDVKKDSSVIISETYQKILNVIRSSIYYEPDASKACIFVSSYDTLDRDPLSPDFQKNLPPFLPLDNGKNHLVFNLYSGTWPNYNELDFSDFNPGYAILVKASTSYTHYRPGFDISLPLFSRSHPEKGTTLSVMSNTVISGTGYDEVNIGNAAESTVANSRTNLLVFKGKRYIYGIGSETRNTLHHLHNNKDILIFTTCKHGKKWKEWKDERCIHDNREYEQYDYFTLLSNSTFCLVPRGRRLGSFRFLEALSYGCIPVLLSNYWVKPFEDVIDWSEIVIEGDERNLLQLPEILRSIGWKKIAKMRSQSIAIYETYFSSVERIVLTTISVLSERIQSQLSLNSFMWNLVNPGFTSFHGAIWFDGDFSYNLHDYPGYRNSNSFTIVIYVNRAISAANLHRLIRVVSKSQFLSRIIIIWALPISSPLFIGRNSVSFFKVPIELIIPKIKTINAKIYPYEAIRTDAVLNLDPESNLSAEELDFAFLVWRAFPHRIVGFSARDHYYDDVQSTWFYTSKWTNQYSIILLDAAFYHRYYSWIYTHHISTNIALNRENNENLEFNDLFNNDMLTDDSLCLDLVFNFLVAHITREGPIKVTQRKKTSNSTLTDANTSKIESFKFHKKCFSTLINSTFGYLPLIKSQMRFDPILFKDPVSNLRKKYRKLEQMK